MPLAGAVRNKTIEMESDPERTMTDWNSPEEHVDRALELFRRGRLEEAEDFLRSALEVTPDRGDWQFNLALILDAAGRTE